MWELLKAILSPSQYMPHGNCYLWQTSLVWLHLVSDLLIGVAYLSITAMLLYFLNKRKKEVPFQGVFALFGAFIILCGLGHLLEIWTLWHPAYWLSGIEQAMTALVSCWTALQMATLLPQFLALKTPEQLEAVNRELEKALENELKLTEATTKFVPNQFLSLMGYKNITDVKLEDSVKYKMSVLFADIRNFTTILETMKPEESFRFINGYLSQMEPAIIEHHGFIDKYIGDAIMALFAGKTDDAVRGAISMLKRLREYNKTRQRPNRRPLKIGIGINTGDLILGTVGGTHRMDGTVVGDAVNIASRLEGLTKLYDVSLLISNSTFDSLENPLEYSIRLIDRVKVKGKTEMVTFFEVFDVDSPECVEGKKMTKPIFEEAMMLYSQRKMSQAARLFQDCLNKNPSDRVAQIYLERCQI